MHPMYAPQPNHYRPGSGMPGGMSGPGMHMGLPPPQLQCYCPACNMLLSFPSGSTLVQCPQCQTTMNTQPSVPPPPPIAPPPPQPPASMAASQQQALNFLNCPQCQILLSHPPSSITIQCPRCMNIIDVSHKAATITAASDQSAGAGGAGGGHSPLAAKQAALPEVVVRKKRKDPHAPKRASNAYMIFCKERRAQLKLDRPDLPFGQLGKRLGEMWRSMTPQEKKLYEDRATGDRDRYKGEMTSYQSTAMMKGGRGSGTSGSGGGGGAAGKSGSGQDAGSEPDRDHEDDGEYDEEGDAEDDGGDGGSVQEEDEHEVKLREKQQNGTAKRVKAEVKANGGDSQSPPAEKEPTSEPAA